MNSSQFQALIKALKSADIPKFVSLVDQFNPHSQNNLISSKNYDNFRTDLEKAYYNSISIKLNAWG